MGRVVRAVTAASAVTLLAAGTGPASVLVVDADGTPLDGASVYVDEAAGPILGPSIGAGVAEAIAGLLGGTAQVDLPPVCDPPGPTGAPSTTSADGGRAALPASDEQLRAVTATEPGGAATLLVGAADADPATLPLWTEAPPISVAEGTVRRTGVLPASLGAQAEARVDGGNWLVTVDGAPLACGDGLLSEHVFEDTTAELRWVTYVSTPGQELLAVSRPTQVTGASPPASRGAPCTVQPEDATAAPTEPCAATDGDLLGEAVEVGPGEALLVLLPAPVDGADVMLRGTDVRLEIRTRAGSWSSLQPTTYGATDRYSTTFTADAVRAVPTRDATAAAVVEIAVWDARAKASRQELLDEIVANRRAAQEAASDGEEPARTDDPDAALAADAREQTLDALTRQVLPVVVLAAGGAAWAASRSRPGRSRRRRDRDG